MVIPGRAFLHRLIDLTLGVMRPHFRIRLSPEVKADMLVWQTFLSGFNGRSFFLSGMIGMIHVNSSCIPLLRAPLVLVLFLVGIGAMVNGPIAGGIAILHT